MRRHYFFIHIPKTAGTSFRSALEANASVHMLRDYGEKSAKSTKELMEVPFESLTSDNPIFHKEKQNVLCGHISFRKYAHCIEPDAVISILRNPVERVISEYQHVQRVNGYSGSFAQFFASPPQQNKQARMLGGLESKSGALVGLTSHYRQFVKVFSAKYGLQIMPAAQNKAPRADAEARFNMPPSEVRAAYAANKEDIEFFFEQVLSFKAEVEDNGFNSVPSQDTDWKCRIDEHRCVVGWISCSYDDCYFILIEVNGEKRAVIAPDQFRAEIYKKGLSANPVCGFNYPLSLVGAEIGDEIAVSIMGASGFRKIFILTEDV